MADQSETPPWLKPPSNECWVDGEPGEFDVEGLKYICRKHEVEWKVPGPFYVRTRDQVIEEYRIKERTIARAYDVTLVDFTQPNALSSPA